MYSIILLSYYSEQRIVNVFNRVSKALEQEQIPFEFIIMDDGSKDNSYQVALELEKQDSSLTFTLQSPSDSKEKIYKKVNNFLDSKFKEYTLKNNEQEQLWINLKGNGYQYKRNLESDLNILLK